ncbi:hypothetical protein EYV94_01270 [Puteibacter caeruleilacunae]|nr:hypothetical protein EYV94_01270 [Puteibacter caeruleilacunae]
MLRQKYICLLFLLLLVGGSSYAQNNTSSPYSRFGIGELENVTGGRYNAMGGVSIGMRSDIYLNLNNPASLTAISRESFATDVGVNLEYTDLSSKGQSNQQVDGNLGWFQFAFPVTSKLYAGFSLQPKSSVGYKILATKLIEGTQTQYGVSYEGTGGLTQAAFALGYKFSDKFSAGGKFSYIWGNVAETQREAPPLGQSFTIDIFEDTNYRGGYLDLGLQYDAKFSENTQMTFGTTAGISTPMKTRSDFVIRRNYGTGTSAPIDEDFDRADNMRLPLELGAGFSLKHKLKYIWAFDYKWADWKNADLNGSDKNFQVNQSFRAGFEYVPKMDILQYRNVMRYRVGLRYDTGYLKVKNDEVADIAMSLGVAVPVRKEKSTLNFSLEFGQRGNNSLIRERYMKLNVGFNFWERWFFKRQFD